MRQMIVRVGSGDANCWSARQQEGGLAQDAVRRSGREGRHVAAKRRGPREEAGVQG